MITLGAMLGGLFVSFAGAFGISHLRGKISQNLYLYFVFGQIVPFHAVMIPISVLATNTNLTNSLEELSFLILDSSVRLEFDVYGIFEKCTSGAGRSSRNRWMWSFSNYDADRISTC